MQQIFQMLFKKCKGLAKQAEALVKMAKLRLSTLQKTGTA